MCDRIESRAAGGRVWQRRPILATAASTSPPYHNQMRERSQFAKGERAALNAPRKYQASTVWSPTPCIFPQRRERRPRFDGSRLACHAFHPELSGTPAPPDDLDPSTPSLTVALHPIGGDPPPLYRSRAAKVYRSLAVSLRCGPLICPPPSTMLPPLQTSCLPLRS